MLSKEQFIALKQQVFLLATQIGLRQAARSMGLSEDRVRRWSSDEKWNLATIRPHANGAVISPKLTSAREVYNQTMAHLEDRARIAMANVGTRAFEHAGECSDEQLHERDRAIALQNHGKNLQLAHQWFPNALGSNVAVQVNVPMPTAEERQEMRDMDRKLDAIAAKLKAKH